MTMHQLSIVSAGAHLQCLQSLLAWTVTLELASPVVAA